MRARAERLLPLLAPLCALVPLVCFPGTRDAFAVPQAAAAACAALLAAAVLALAGRLEEGAALDAPVAAFLAAAVSSTTFSIDKTLSLFGAYPDPVFSLTGLACAAAALRLGAALSAAGRAAQLRRWIVGAAAFASAYALLQRAGVEPFLPLAGLPEGLRPVSTLGSPLFLGAYLALALPLALETFREGRRLLAGTALGLLLPALAFTLTRAAWLGAASAALLWLFLRGPRPEARVLRRGALLALVLGLLALVLLRARPSAGGGDVARRDCWRIAVRAALERPLLGTGPDTYVVPYRMWRSPEHVRALGGSNAQTQAHDDLLQMLSTLGFLGLLAYLWLHAEFFRGARRALRADASAAAAPLCAAFAVWVCVKFGPASLPVVWTAALFAGACAGESPSRPCWARTSSRALLALCLFFPAAVSLRAFAADREARLGLRARRIGEPRAGAEHLEKAVALRPELVAYRYDLVNLLRDAAGGRAVPLLSARARVLALEGALRRPLDADAQRLVALVELYAVRAGEEGRLPRAREALRRALELDPHSPSSRRLEEEAVLLSGRERRRF